MNSIQRKAVSIATSGAILLSLVAPAVAGEIIISQNGAGSDNYVTVTQTTTTTVTQSNVANVTNDVDADADTGNNDADFNTGGDVMIVTGNAKAYVDVENTLNSNIADVDCCVPDDTEVLIKNNGAMSNNDVELVQIARTNVDQDNFANVRNDIEYINADTGNNSAGLNTGGDVVISTGNALADVSVSTHANSNSATVGGDYGDMMAPHASFKILGNGAFSDNFITAGLFKSVRVDQDNVARVTNDVDADADTGDNDAGFNTDGAVAIVTGNAKVFVDVDNMLNFNHADVDCGCTWDVHAEIARNGAEGGYSHPCGEYQGGYCGDMDNNVIALVLDSRQVFLQDNLANLSNDVTRIDADTGDNGAGLNGGDTGDDPSILTGDAMVDIGVYNTVNTNSIGDLFEWPWDNIQMKDYDLSMDFMALLAYFGLHIG